MSSADDLLPTYKPSVWYFRRALRESGSTERAITVALVVLAEWEQLQIWSGEQGITPAVESDAATNCLREAIRLAGSHGQAILLGLFLCHELEQLKALARTHDLIPPKWIVAPEEAEEKGWADEERAADF